MRLSHRDYDALLRTILDVHDLALTPALLEKAPDVIGKLIPADYVALFSSRVDRATMAVDFDGVWETEPRMTKEQLARLRDHFPEHPFTRVWADPTTLTAAMCLSDFFSTRQLEAMWWYREIYQTVSIGRLLAIATPHSDGPFTISVIRRAKERDFTERDRLLLTLLRPHLEQARAVTHLFHAGDRDATHRLRGLGLTTRECEVAVWVGHGKTNAEIATILNAKVRTIEKHVENILRKLGVVNRTAAAMVINGVEPK